MDLERPAAQSGDAYELVDPLEPRSAPKVPEFALRPSDAPMAPASDPGSAATLQQPDQPKGNQGSLKTVRKRRHRRSRWEAPAWGVSVIVHSGVLVFMALLTLAPAEVAKVANNLNTALIDAHNPASEPEPLPILADPQNMPRDQAVGTSMPTMSQGLGTGTGQPSTTPPVGVGNGAAVGAVSERTGSLAGVQVVAQISGMSLLPAAPAVDLSGGGMIAGDVTYSATDIGAALDQLAREILRHLEAHKLTVVWLFDESASMKDDQQAIRDKFGRIASELKLNLDEDKKSIGALNHAIVGFGQGIHYELEKPTVDIDQIGKAIDHLRVDETGTENTLEAILEVIGKYGRLISKDRRLLIVLVTDESGDDGSYVEEARQQAVNRGVPIYVIGRQSLFGFENVRLVYTDPVTKDRYWPTIHRGPETAGLEILQWDGLHERWEGQSSGFAPYELARITKDSGGIYFLLPSEENMRLQQREKAYSITTLKEYVPDYESRVTYIQRRNKSELRSTLFEVIQTANPKGNVKSPYFARRHFPIDATLLLPAALEAGQAATVRLNELIEVEKRLRTQQKARDREPERRWQANYDLMLAQVVAYQVKAYEYRACMKEIVELYQAGNPPQPRRKPSSDLIVVWEINHATTRKAPKEETEKKYAEAQRLLKLVIERHPRTPWADLAQDELNRGLGVERGEWAHSPRYDERAKLVPKY